MDKKAKTIIGIMALIIIALIVVIIVLTTSHQVSDGSNQAEANYYGITTSYGNGVMSNPISTAKIDFQHIGITKSGDFVIKVTNNNEEPVCLSSIKTIFKDANGNFALTKEADQSFVTIPAKGVTYVYDWGFKENYAQYPTYEFSCELANIADSFVSDGIKITSNNTGKQVAVTLANNSGFSISDARVVVLYYQGDIIVGAESGYANQTVSAGNNAYINVDYPDDSNYKNVSFDKYEVYFINAHKSY